MSQSPPPRRRHRSQSRSRGRRRDRHSDRTSGLDRDGSDRIERGRRDRDEDGGRRGRRRDEDHERRSRRDRRRSRSPRRFGRESRDDKDTTRESAGTTITRGKPLPPQEVALKDELDPNRERSKSPEKANFNPTGILAKVANTTATGTVLKYTEPGEGRKPPASQVWKLFVFKDGNIAQEIELNEKSCWLFGRDRNVVDVPTDHPSCSSQHAVIQFRWIVKTNEYGDKKGGVKPYIIDLDSANGTFLAGEEIPKTRYVELRKGDLLKFGSSSREYVLMMDKA